MERYAVIDLGTNTFHLLIASFDIEGQLINYQRERVFVKLAEEGIETIASAPFQRGIGAIQQFKKTLDEAPPIALKAFGTAALRTASNASEFVQTIKSKSGINVEVISGQEEAQLIYLGVKQVVDFTDEHDLIMDVGGGSVEFIIANNKGVKWSESFPIGVAVLFKKFHTSDPISAQNIHSLKEHLASVLNPLKTAIKQFPIHRLVGASGTFDVLEDNLSNEHYPAEISNFSVNAFLPFCQKIILLNQSERLMLNNIPESRADMIVVALLLINEVIDFAQINEVIVSPYALKEGALFQMAYDQ